VRSSPWPAVLPVRGYTGCLGRSETRVARRPLPCSPEVADARFPIAATGTCGERFGDIGTFPLCGRGTIAMPHDCDRLLRIFLEFCCERHLARPPAATPERHLLHRVVVQRRVSVKGHDSSNKTRRFCGLV